jgi:hypothetical protein
MMSGSKDWYGVKRVVIDTRGVDPIRTLLVGACRRPRPTIAIARSAVSVPEGSVSGVRYNVTDPRRRGIAKEIFRARGGRH